MRHLFIGTFLSHKTGTKSIAEKLRDHWNGQRQIDLVSHIENKPLRMMHILLKCFVHPSKRVFIDVFSGAAFQIADKASQVLFKRNKEVILTLRGGGIPAHFEKQEDDYRALFARANRIQTPSLFIQEFLEDKGIEIHYMPNPVKLKHFESKNNIRRNQKLLWVRAFDPIYQPDVAIETLSILLKEFPDLRLTMIGPDKGGLSKAEDTVQRLGLENKVEFVGPVSNELLPVWYNNHQVYLNTTTLESFGTAVVEAAACEIAIVSTPAGEIPYLWKHKEQMWIADDFKANSMARGVAELLRSEEKRKRYGKAARERAMEFEWDNVLQRWEEELDRK